MKFKLRIIIEFCIFVYYWASNKSIIFKLLNKKLTNVFVTE